MAFEVNRGEIWMYRFAPPDKCRPVLVLTRAGTVRFMTQLIVVSITSTLRDAPTEVHIGIEEGLKHASAINLYQIFTVEKSLLRKYVSTLGLDKMRQVCQALTYAAGC